MKTIYVICFFPFYVFDSNQIFALDLCLSGYMFWEILFLFFFNSVFSKDFFANIIFLFFRFSFFYKFFFASLVFVPWMYINFSFSKLQVCKLGFVFSRCIDIPNGLLLYVRITKVWHYKVTHLFQEPR
jgi:hypothetical protein